MHPPLHLLLFFHLLFVGFLGARTDWKFLLQKQMLTKLPVLGCRFVVFDHSLFKKREGIKHLSVCITTISEKLSFVAYLAYTSVLGGQKFLRII
jgi:hypothetical protein